MFLSVLLKKLQSNKITALGPVHRQEFFIPHTPFLYNKPIGAPPGRDYYLICVVAKKMVRTTINLVGTLQHCTV